MLNKVQSSNNEKTANAILKFINSKKLYGDIRIYFNEKAFEVDYQGNVKTIENINPKDYFEYANPETVAMSFEGEFYNVINGLVYYNGGYWKLYEQFNNLIKKYGYYFELGNAWNLSLYKI